MSERIVSIGIVGCGPRTETLLGSLLYLEGVRVSAICDIKVEALEHVAEIFKKKDRPAPLKFVNYHDMLASPEVEGVLVSTSWNSHLGIARDALAAGKYAAIEVGGASSEHELWELVTAAEKTGVPCMMLENCCYGRDELMVMNMVRQGLLGELVYCEGGYEHDLSEYAQLVHVGFERAIHNRGRCGDVYPTHELGPIAKILGINRGNRFVSLSSFATRPRRWNERAKAFYESAEGTPASNQLRNYWVSKVGEDYRKTIGAPACAGGLNYDFNMGDVVTTVIRCANGQNVTMTHGVSLPRPYSRNGRVQGTKGIWLENAKGMFVEGISTTREEIDVAGNPYTVHDWTPVEDLYEKYDHPIWQDNRKNATIGGHGGMDALALRAFLDAIRNRTQTPIDVYDIATWMAVTYLSEQSIALGGAPVPFPDFTDGKWLTRPLITPGYWSL